MYMCIYIHTCIHTYIHTYTHIRYYYVSHTSVPNFVCVSQQYNSTHVQIMCACVCL